MKRLNIKQTVLAAALVVGTALAAVAADPITYTWTGASGDNANWSNPANWDQNNGKVPGTADWAIIPASAGGQPWQITIDKNTTKPADFYAAGPTVFSGGFTLNAQVNGASGNGVLSQGKMEVTGEKTAASFSGVTKTAPMKLASDASYLASEGGSITFGYLCFDNSKDISFAASNQNSKVTLSTMWTNAGGTAQPNLNENNTGLFFGAYDGGLLTLSPDIKFVTGNDPTFIANGGKIVASKTQATTADAVLNVTSTNGGTVTFGSVMGSLVADSSEGSCIVFGGGTGNPTINCEGVGSVVTNTGTLTGNATVTAKDGAFVKLGTVNGDAKIDSSNGGNVYYTWKTKGNADVTSAGEGSGVTNTANMTGNVVAKSTDKGFVKFGNVSGSFDLTADGEGTAMVFGSVGKAGLDSSLKVSDKAKVTTGATSGSVTLVADKGATAELTSTMATGTHSLTAKDEGTLVWVKGAITGDTTIDASTMATVQVVNATAAAQGITGAATMTACGGSLIKTGKVSKNVTLTADGEGSSILVASTAGVAGTDSSATASNKGSVWVQGAITGNKVTIDASNMSTVQVANATGTAQGITGAAEMSASGGSLVKAGNVTKAVDLTADGAGSSVTIGTAGAADSVSSITAKNGGVVTAGAMKGTVTIDVDEVSQATVASVAGATTLQCAGETASLTLGAIGVAGGNSAVTVTDGATVKATGSVIGNVKIDVDNGATASLTYSSTTQSAANHTVTCFGEGSSLLVANGVSGNLDLKCGDKASVSYTNSKGITGQFNVEGEGEGTTIAMYALGKAGLDSTLKLTDKVVFSTTGAVAGNVTLEADKGATATIGGALGSTGGNVSLTAADDGTLVLVKGATAGNVAIAVDKGAVATLASTMATGNHTIACSNEDSVVWIQNTVTGNPVITCEDKGTVKLVKADNVSLIGVTGYPTVLCSGEGSSVTMGNLGATAAGVNVLKATDGATVTVGTTKFTIQAEASNGALLKMGSMTPSADNNEIVADNATIQFTGAMNGNKSFTSVYEVKGADGLIEGVKAGLLFGSDAKTTVKLMPLRSRSSSFIKTTTSGDLTFGAGVKYVVDVSDVSQDAFYGDKKFLIAESAGKLTFNAPTSVSVTGADPAFYSASLAAEGTKLYLTITCRKVPEGMVAVVGIDEFYPTLGEAVEKVQDGGLIGVMVDVAVAEKIANPAGKTVTLNLNGNALTSALTDCVIDNAGTLVLKGAGAIASETAGVLIINRPTGVLTIEDGTYTCAKVLENQAQEENLGTVTIATAVFNGTTENKGTLSVAGGTFGTLRNNGMLSVSGGTIAGDEYALYNCCTATLSGGVFDGIVACDGDVGALEITGGAFKSELVEKTDSAEIVIAGLVGVSLNKATFAIDETDYCEDGFVTFKNGDVYIVRRATDVVITPVNTNTELGTLTVENAGEQIRELGETLCGTITNVKEGFIPVILVGGQRVEVAQDGSFEGPAVESAEVVAAYVRADAWYLDPFARNTFTLRSTYSPIGMIMDEDETFIAQNGDPGSDNYGLAGILAETVRTSVNPKLGYVWNRGEGTGGKHSSYRQMAVSSYHQAVFGCPWYASDNAVYVVPFDPAKEVTNVQIDWGELENLSSKMFWGFPIGEKIYYQNGSKNVNGEYDIYQFTVVKDGDVITGLKADGLVGSGADGAHGLLVDGVPYAYTWDSGSVKVVNLADGSVTTNLIDGSVLSTVRRTQITGVADGIPHLVLHGDKGIGIYALAPDMVHLAGSTPIVYLNSSALIGGADAAFAGTTAFDDEKTYVFCDRGGQFHIFEHRPAQLIVRGTFSDEANAEGDVLVDFGGAVEKTYSAPKDYMITAVKVNGVADSNFTDASYTYSNAALDTHVYIAMTIEKRPVAQIGSVKYTELDAAFAAAKAGDTVTLLRDVEVSDPLAVGVAMTFDLGGKSLTRAAGASGFMITVNAKVDIVNGVIDGGTVEAVKVEKTGDLFLDDIKVTSAARTFFESHGKTTVGGNAAITAVGVDTLWVAEGEFNVYGTIENIGSSYPTLWIDNGELNFYEGSVLTSTAEDIVRSNAGSCQVNVYGGTFSCVNSYPVFYFYRDSTATITIKGGQFESVLFNIIDAVTVTPLDNTCTAKFKDDTGLAARCAEGFAPVKGVDDYYTIQKLYDITIAAAENGTVETSVTNGIVAGTEVTITVTPAETYAVDKVYTNNVELAAVYDGYSFLMPAENVEVKATFKATARPPYEPIPTTDPEGDAAKMNDEDGTVKPECINAPYDMGTDAKAAYAKLFTAVPGVGVVTIELNKDGTNAVETAEQAAGEAALDAVLGAEGDSAAMEVKTPLAGFFYSLKQSAAVESLGFKADTDKNKLGGRDKVSFTLDKSETSGFYQMIVTPTMVK